MKAAFDMAGMTLAGIIGSIVAQASDVAAPITVSAVVAMFTFGGLLVRSLLRGEKLLVDVIDAKDKMIADERAAHEETRRRDAEALAALRAELKVTKELGGK